MLHPQQLALGFRQIVAAHGGLQQHPAVHSALNEQDNAPQALLQALASCLVHDQVPQLVLQFLRPCVLDLMVRLMDPVIVIYDFNVANNSFKPCVDPMLRSERIAEALVTLLAFVPQTWNVVQQYSLDSPCFFEFVNVAGAKKQQSAQTTERLRRIVKTTYRLIRLHPHEAVPLWNWSGYFPLCFHEDTCIRWYAARTTAVVLQMGNSQRNAFIDGLQIGEDAAVDGKHPAVRKIELEEHQFEVQHQEQRILLTVQDPNSGLSEDDQSAVLVDPVQSLPFHESLRNICGVIVPTNKQQAQRESATATEPLVATTSTKRNLQSVAIALGLKRPILVSGSSGCGKTALVRELSRLSGNGDLVELHLDDQIDSKTLLGSYVCTDIPGEFTWQPGALTIAVLEGRWVVIEDIDRAPFEVLAALMPLFETREMVLPGRGELLVAHPNFQIFGTTSSGHNMPKGFQESMWTSVNVHPLGDEEIKEVIQTRFNRIPAHVVEKIMTTFNVVSGHAHVNSTTALTHLWNETRRNYGRAFCLRDILKWCKRIYSFCSIGRADVNETQQEYVTEDERLRILIEAFDVFCAGIREPSTRLQAALAIADIWQVQEERIRYTLEQQKPHVTFNTREVEFGRVHLPTLSREERQESARSSVVMTGHVLRLLEKLAAIVYTCEPALLIGETGCGKTTIIQHLAASMGQTLVVQNLNIQSDSSDLVGGFKPVEIHLLARPLYMSFVDLFTTTFSQKSNASFLNLVRVAFEHKDWKKMVKGMQKAIQMANTKLNNDTDGDSPNKMAVRGASPNVLANKWDDFDAELTRFKRQKEQVESHFAFAFVEGVLVKALREGHWVLLDEINLASSDTLERISTLLEHETSAFSITERGDVEVIRPHPNFRIFGAMNPSTDVGKKDLPPSMRNRFTEIYVDECVCPADLQMVVEHQLKEIAGAPIPETVAFYLEARKQAEERLSDGARHKPRYSLRTLSQALHITRILIQRGYGVPRAMYEGFSSSFCTQLDIDSRTYLEKLIKNTFAKTMKAKELLRAPPRPGGKTMVNEFILVSSYWVRGGGFMEPRDDAQVDPVTSRKNFVLTKSVEENLRHVARAALISKYPVLLQGPTSAGKTSLISYLAARLGQKCVRINNHEHTDIQEYLGSYVSDSNGKLAFKEGVLVEAVRNGWWIILDELNLAPSEVLEALNRLLDDNRELFLPETQETVKPHPKFMLFATQNPPGLYGGRKVLSRAFRNRFLEIQVDEVPSQELQTILQERSSLPPSYCAILIDIMRQLQLVRQQSSVFAGKSGFITTRDLLRWAERRPATKQALAEEGYCLLAERLRKDEEKLLVKQVLEQKCNVKIDLDALYFTGKPRESNLLNQEGEVEQEIVWGTHEHFEQVQQMVEQALSNADGDSKIEGNAAGLEKISITKSLRRLFALVGRCLQHEEPVLLVGETGCGKTTVCQLYSLLFNQPLHILNCHQHTETSDFLGCLRPVRGKENIVHRLQDALVQILCIGDPDDEANIQNLSLVDLLSKYERARTSLLKREEDKAQISSLVEDIDNLKRRHQSIFEWVDGPLVESMKNGDLLLVDEVNLAEDAVLERLNSVLEPSRTLLLAEKGGDQVEEIVANPKWRIMATMNPGGDFGKRELSPALRNRFTEIWVPAISDLGDIATIIHDRLVGKTGTVTSPLASLCDPILSFVRQFNDSNGGLGGCGSVTLRDILSWINFICSVMKRGVKSDAAVSPWIAFVQGAALSVLDGLGLGSDKALHTALKAREEAYQYLLALVPCDDENVTQSVLQSLNATKQAIDDSISGLTSEDGTCFGIHPFMISRGPDPEIKKPSFSLKAPTTMSNMYRVLRAMQVSRPIILEGSPGVGKTSLISALAAASGHKLVRINLSEQTDISDLFGSDLPAAESSTSGNFEWCDGVFLRALKAGDWVLLDELNLASQSVLEGLNSCLDHRGSVYIPELDREFECPSTFKVFAAQNPLRQGGGRKGLPKSFLNRFTRVFVDTLEEQDLIHIASAIYPSLHHETSDAMDDGSNMGSLLERMIKFNSAVHEDTMVDCKYGRLGAPWEFNLRDVFRFCELVEHQKANWTSEEELQALSYYVNFIYVERMRSSRDRALISSRFEQFFGVRPVNVNNVPFRVTDKYVEIGNAFLPRHPELRVGRVTPPLFNFLLKPMEALVHCVNMNWPALLVGPPACGKTSAVRLLAALSGNTLHELGMSAGTDATELLGCFEQVDVGRKLRDVKRRLSLIYEEVVQLLVVAASQLPKKKTALMKLVNHLGRSWWAITTRENDSNENKSGSRNKQLTKGQLDEVLIDLMKDVVSTLSKATNALEQEDELSSVILSKLDTITGDMNQVIMLSTNTSISSCFEWVDGTLIHAMENGEWILLDNVNFCSSSVLDRLNSLMETGGELLINECGLINGKLRVIKPHANFRIFLAMDPQFGEVSRAMRNRCVEIALVDGEEQKLDLIKIASATGIPGFALCQAFQTVHQLVTGKLAENMISAQYAGINRRHLQNWSLLATVEMNRGIAPLSAIADSFQRVYGQDLLTQLDVSSEVLDTFLNALNASVSSPQKQRVLVTNTSTLELCQDAEGAVQAREFSYLEYLLAYGENAPSDGNDVLLSKLSSTIVQMDVDSEKNWLSFLAVRKQISKVDYRESVLAEAKDALSTKAFFPESSLAKTLAPFVLRRLTEVTSSVSVAPEHILFSLEKITASQSDSNSAQLLARFVTSLLKNDLYVCVAQEMQESVQALVTRAGECSIFSDFFPVFLSQHDASFKRAVSLVHQLSKSNPALETELELILSSIKHGQQKLEILDGIEWLRFCEEEQFRLVDDELASSKGKSASDRKAKKATSVKQRDLSDFSVLQQSYAIHQHQVDRSNVDNELVFLIYPFLKAFDSFTSVLVSDSKNLAEEKALFNAIKRVVRDRFEFSIQLREKSFDWTHFLIHWQWTLKSINRLSKILDSFTGGQWSTQHDEVTDMTQRMQEMIEKLIGCGSKKNVLWKNGGHALLPNNAELWNARYLLERLTTNFMQVNSCFSSVDATDDGDVDVLALLFGGVSSMEAAMKSGKLDVSSLFYVNVDARKEILHALCAFSYLSQQQVNAKQGKKNVAEKSSHAMASELFKLPGVLLKKLQEQQSDMNSVISKRTLYLSEIEDTAESHVDLLSDEESRVGKDVPILLFDMKESSKLMEELVKFQLSPLMEHSLARSEVDAIAQLVHVVNSYQLAVDSSKNEDVVKDITQLLVTLESLIESLLNLGMRDPASFYAYQDIVWCGHKFINAAEQKEVDLSSELDGFVRLVKTHLNGVLFGFHQFLRSNSFNHMDLISYEIFDTQRKLRKATNKNQGKKKAMTVDEEEHVHVVHGFPRLFHCAESGLMLKSVAEVDLQESSCAAIEAQVRSNRLEKIKKHFATTETQTSKHMVSASFSYIKELFIATVLAFKTTFADTEQWAEVQKLLAAFSNAESDDKLRSRVVTQLLAALKLSTDSTFVSCVDELIKPFLASLPTNAAMHKATGNGNSNASLFGSCFTLLGMLRFVLVVPSSPVDPVTKPLVKKEMLLSRLAMSTMQDAVDAVIDRISALPAASATTVENKEAKMSSLHDQVVELSAYAIQRFNPVQRNASDESVKEVAMSVFGDMFRDLIRFQSTIMSTSKMVAMVSTIRSSMKSNNKCRQLLRELEMFQQTSESFLAQLLNKYGASFRDVLEPVVSAIYVVKEGVAFLTWSAYEHIQERSVKRQTKQDLALALVQFPSIPSTTQDVSDPWRVIQLLLETVGSKTSGLVFGGSYNKRKSDVALLDVALAKMDFLFRETVALKQSSEMEIALVSSKALFDLFLTKWQEQKEREEQKRKEEEEMFKYKVRQLDIETEEQLLEEEYRQQFPDYTVSDFQAFLAPNEATQNGASGVANAVDVDMLISDTMLQRLCEVHSKLYAASACSKISVSKHEIVHSFARAFTLAVSMRKTINAMDSSAVEHAVVSSGVFASSLVQSRLGNGLKSGVPTIQSLDSNYIRGIDFHRDPLVKEVVLVAEPLQQLMIKLQGLLALWPDHAILQQLVLISDRIRNFEISSPLARTLTGVELLLRKAQEWEVYAARMYSIAPELNALSALVTRWRKLELYSWPHLLYVKEKQHRLVAQKTWISMYSLLTAQFESDAESMNESNLFDPTGKSELKWLHLNDLSAWIFKSTASVDAVTVSDARVQQNEWMSKLFSTLDAYVRTCPIGQYETRLLIIYSFCSQLLMEFWTLHTNEDSSASRTMYALANVLYNLYRYYGQHLSFLERQWSGLKAPIQRKLIEFVKICRWDEQTYYSLAESAEKSHRKLMKFVRNYDAVLTVSMQTVIDASTDSGISKDGGYVGIHSTRTELDNLDDGVVLPKEDEHEKEEPKDEDEVNKTSKTNPEVNVEDDTPLKQPVLRLVHKSSSFSSDEVVVKGSAYADKLPALSKRIAKYTNQQIISVDQVEARQQTREICEDLCETIFYRMHKLQKDTRLPKGAKKKALIDLLSELKTQGMSYHRTHLPAEQQNIEQLFQLDPPDVENCIQLDDMEALVDLEALNPALVEEGLKKLKSKQKKKSKKLKKSGEKVSVASAAEPLVKNSPLWLWQRADGYYYRFLGQLAALRFSALTSFSHDLSASEVDRMNGYAENMLFTMIQQRQLLHASSLSHEKLIHGLDALERLKNFQQTYLGDKKEKNKMDLKSVNEWQAHQHHAALDLRQPLRELEIVVNQVLRTSSSLAVAQVNDKFGRAFTILDTISKSLAPSAGVRSSLGVPAIPHHSMNSSEETDDDVKLMAFAHPTNRVYGIAPRALAEVDNSLFPVDAAVLKENSAHLAEVRSILSDISDLFAQVSPTNCFDDLAARVSWVVRQDETLAVAASATQTVSVDKQSEAEAAEAMSAFGSVYDKMVETVLVSIQDLTKLSTESKEVKDNADEEEEATIRQQVSLLTSAVKDARVNQIASLLSELISLLSQQYSHIVSTSSPHWKNAFSSCLSLLKAFEPSLMDLRGINRQLLSDFLMVHKSVMKLDFILVRIFRNLYQHGFCRVDEKEGDEGGGDGKMQFQDDVDGTGMGEGEGKKDVSNEIEDEEQLLGLKGEEQQEQDKSDQPPEDTGLEMENDFEGTMQDIPEDEKDEQDENKDDEEELDREMGDFDQEDENVVDEKMWGDDSDDDDDNIDKEKEKFEEDSKVEGSEALEDEIRGKDGDEDESKEQEKPKDEQKAQPEQQQQPDADGGDGEDDGDDDDGEDEKDEEVNDDFEDKYEEHHDNVDPQSRDDDKDPEQAEDDDALPENMQLDEGDDAGDDGGDGDDADDEGDDQAEPMDEDGDDNGEEQTGEQDPEDEESNEQADEEPLDQAVQMGAGGLDDENEEAKEEEEEKEDEASPEDPSQEKNSSTVAGTQSKDGVDELEQDENADEEEKDQDMDDANAEDNESNEQNSSSSAQQQSSNNKDDKQDWKPQSQVTKSDQAQEKEEKRRNRRNEPNPYRNPQNTQEHWKRRVEMIEREQKEENKSPNEKKSDEATGDMATAEFVDDDDQNMEDVEHALAAADENQLMNQNNSDNTDEQEDKDDNNEPDGVSAMDVDDDLEQNGAQDDEKNSEVKEEKTQAKKEPRDSDDRDMDSKFMDPETEPEDKSKFDEAIRKNEDANMDDDEPDNDALPTQVHTSPLEQQRLDEEDELEDSRPPPKLLSPEEITGLRDELDTFIANWTRSDSNAMMRGTELWSKYTAITASSSQRLCEQLRLVLEPMLRAKLEGDFRTGKRINMRKVIPYIASQFRKDKIWMRRTRPSKRQYQVMIAIDDSESMADNHAGRLALEAMTTLCKGMTQLEVGEISLVKFGQDIQLLHPFDMPFTDDAGSRVISQFGFQQTKTNMVQTLDAILHVLDNAKNASTAASNASNVEFTQIVFLISDGRFDTDGRMRIKKLIETALEQQQLIVLLIVDQASNAENSILETKSVAFTKGKVTMTPYLENYPFPYYVLLPNSALLPEILSDSLRQWFEMLQMKN